MNAPHDLHPHIQRRALTVPMIDAFGRFVAGVVSRRRPQESSGQA